MLSIAEFYDPNRWTLGFWEWGPDYTIVKNRHIGLDIGTGRRPIDVPCLYGGKVIIVTKTRSMGWVVVIDTGLPGNRRYHAYCHLSAYDLPRPGAIIGRGGRVGRLAAGPKTLPYADANYPGTAWGGIHLHLVLSDISFGAYTIGAGASFANPETFIREQLAGQAAGGGSRPFDPEEDDMFTDEDRRKLEHVYQTTTPGIPNVKHAGETRNAVIEARDNAKAAHALLRSVAEVLERTRAAAQTASDSVTPGIEGVKWDGLLYSLVKNRGNVEVDEKAVATELAPILAPILADNLGTLSDASVDTLVQRLLDEQGRRLTKPSAS